LNLDLLAALTVWALLVPQGLAYAQLAGLDPLFGLYASIGAIVGYALLGGVREMSVGPRRRSRWWSISIVAPLSGGDPVRFITPSSGPRQRIR
jgi:sulfate permease, SulP family